MCNEIWVECKLYCGAKFMYEIMHKLCATVECEGIEMSFHDFCEVLFLAANESRIGLQIGSDSESHGILDRIRLVSSLLVQNRSL